MLVVTVSNAPFFLIAQVASQESGNTLQQDQSGSQSESGLKLTITLGVANWQHLDLDLEGVNLMNTDYC